jgi:plasmid maintenance system antidote protein VapI
MPMKNPPHPGGFVLRECIAPLELTITAASALGSDAHHLVGTGKRKARDFPGDGREIV